MDMVLGEIKCEFSGSSSSSSSSGGSYAAGAWPTGWCHPMDSTCTSLGVKDNMCGECKAWGNGGFSLSETKMGLRFQGYSFDDNEIGEGAGCGGFL